MADWTILKASIANAITTNGNQEITGALLQHVFNNIITSVGENATFAGIATTSTNPGTPDGPVFYLATEAGVYANFSGIEIAEGEAVILQWNNGAWTKKISGFAVREHLMNYINRNGTDIQMIQDEIEDLPSIRDNVETNTNAITAHSEELAAQARPSFSETTRMGAVIRADVTVGGGNVSVARQGVTVSVTETESGESSGISVSGNTIQLRSKNILIYSGEKELNAQIQEHDEKLTELEQETSVFSVMNISNVGIKTKMLNFFKSIKIYDSEIKDLSVWNVIRRDSFIIQITTMTPGDGYYVNYVSDVKENYIRIDKGNGTAVEMVVDWDVLEADSSISDGSRKNTISHKCFHLTPSLNDADKKLKIEELNKKNYTSIAKTKFAFNVEITSEVTWGFYSDIIQKVRVKADKEFINEKTRFALTYLRIESQEERGQFDGLFSFSLIKDGALLSTQSINLYDYGYTKGFTGLLELVDIKPWSNNNILFDIIIDCSKIKLDISYYLGNESSSYFAGKVYILPELYDEIINEDSVFYEALTNKGKNYPIDWADDVTPVSYINNCVLDASIISPQKYKINIAYINRTETNTGGWDNTIGFNVFDDNGNRINNAVFYVKQDEKITLGRTGIVNCFYHLASIDTSIRICWDLGSMPAYSQLGQDSSEPYYNKMPFSEYVYNIVPDTGKKDSFYYNVLTNSNSQFPIHLSEDVSLDNTDIQKLLSFVLYAQIITTNSVEDYTYEVAYANRNANENTGPWDNTIQIGRRKREDLLNTLELVSIRRIEDIMLGKKFWLSYQWDDTKIRLYLDASVLPTGKPLIISNSSGLFNGKQYLDDYCYISIPKVEEAKVEEAKTQTQVAKVVGEELYIGSKFDENNDILIRFAKCMNNDIMTFYSVGLASNTEAYPKDNPERNANQYLNVATSDNIGPISISGGGWCGANHTYKEEGLVKTAETISYEFYADGKKINDGNIVYADKIEIRVKNRIYNPTIAPEDGATILSTELCIEDVVYKIEKGNIFVSLSHTYSNENPVTVVNYYGMQSMCAFETSAMTPNGAYTDFSTDRTSFTKGEYPDFQRIIERNNDKTLYQSTYLFPVLDGNHNRLSDASRVYVSSSGKQYHCILNNNSLGQGDVVAWSGLYSWFKAFRDDDSVLAYTADMNGQTLLFIDAKTAIEQQYIDVPPQLVGADFEIIEKSESITIGDYISSIGLPFRSEGSGSLVCRVTI